MVHPMEQGNPLEYTRDLGGERHLDIIPTERRENLQNPPTVEWQGIKWRDGDAIQQPKIRPTNVPV